MIDTISAIIRAETIDDVVRATLDTIRKEFGWAYASYWTVDPVENVLVFSLESGRVDDEFQRLTRTARFKEGEGLNGRSWRLRDLFHVADLGELHDCCRAPLARRAGIKTAIALPVMRDGQVVGTLDFFSTQAVEISQARLERAADDRPAGLGQVLEAGPAGRPDPDQADGRQRADQHHVRRPRLEGPVHEPEGRADAQAAGAHLPIKVDQMIGQLDRHLSQGARAPAAAAGRPAQPAAHARRSTSAPSCSSCSQRDDRPKREVHRPDDHLGGRDREGRGEGHARPRRPPTSGRSISCCWPWAAAARSAT